MRKFNKVTLIVSACLVAVGALISFAGYIKGGSPLYNIDITKKFGHWYQQSDDKMVDSYELLSDNSDIKGINLNMLYGDVSITADSTARCVSVSTTIPQKHIKAEINSSGMLEVKDMRSKPQINGLHFDFGTGEYAEVNVVVPRDMLDTLSVNLDCGDIKINNLSAGKGSIILDCGDFTVKSCTIGSGRIINSCGDIKIAESSIGLAKITDTLGDISFDSSKILSDLGIKSSCGDVNIENPVNKCVYNVHDSLGSINLGKYKNDNSNSDASIPVVTSDLSCGDFKVY